MNYCEIKNCDIANGLGVRVSLFVSGCRNHCKGCFQPETWDFNYGKPFDEEAQHKVIELLSKTYITGLTLLGGDPFEIENARDLVKFVEKVKRLFPFKNIWCYTGYTFEQLKNRHDTHTEQLLHMIDILVDGPFIEEQKDVSLAFRGSRNQRIIDVKLSTNKPVLANLNIIKENLP